ncbi:hypothetical protein K502DRAFT_349651 [Neoconidiobolus thromboides FSU 785]|nr:hypothetical protein K502DRAFT_349651 [Neoconidiobolus thromboides FSU 785]
MTKFKPSIIFLSLVSTITSIPTSNQQQLSKRYFNFYSTEYKYDSNNGLNTLNTLSFPNILDSSLSTNTNLFRRSFNYYSPGLGYNNGYGGFNNFNSFGFPNVINNDRFNVNANSFNAHQFDRNKKAAVFVDNIHKKDINKSNNNVNKHNSVAII